jgi:L-iditol 2-dehydrogenase
MKAVFLTGIRRFEIKQIADPKIVKETDVLVNIKTVGVCGSDVHYFTTGRIGSQIIRFPFIIGHEAAGIVERVGEKVTRVKPGQRIAIDPTVYCGRCDQCRAGRENTCRDLKFLGCPEQLDGCLREYVVIQENCCYPVSNSMSFERATLSEPLAVAVYAVERSVRTDKVNAAVLGMGPIGISVFHMLRVKNAGRIYVTEKIPERVEYAKALHPAWCGNPNVVDVVKHIADLEPLLLDVVYECSGDEQALHQAVSLLKPGGSLVIVGIPEADHISLPVHVLRRKEITVINIRRQAHCTQKAIDLLDKNLINMDSMVTHHFSLDQTQKAFDLVANYKDGVIKAMISVA